MHRHKKQTSTVEGSVPCGNPRRYGSRDVVHMPPFGSHDKKRKTRHEGDESAATESEKHLKSLITHQMKKDVTIAEQFSQHRTFSLATSHDPGVEKLTGVNNYGKFKSVSDLDTRIDYLRHCGLDDEEITLKLTEEIKDTVPITTGGYGIDPQSKLQKLGEIERKIQEKATSLKVPDSFKGALELSRQALDLERSLGQKRQGKEPSVLDIVTVQKKFEATHPDDPVNHIQEILIDIEGKKEREPRRERRRRRKMKRKQLFYTSLMTGEAAAHGGKPVSGIGNSLLNGHEDGDVNQHSTVLKNNVESSGTVMSAHSVPLNRTAEIANKSDRSLELLSSESQTDPDTGCDKLSHDKQSVPTSECEMRWLRPESTVCVIAESATTVKTINKPIIFISEDEIIKNRLSLEEIRAIDKFQNYTEGEPNKVVYLKNLPLKASVEDLIALFGSFQSDEKPKIVFKLLSGRMKGQAFITFADEITATRAVQLVNGYKLQDKPIILSFGKQHGS